MRGGRPPLQRRLLLREFGGRARRRGRRRGSRGAPRQPGRRVGVAPQRVALFPRGGRAPPGQRARRATSEERRAPGRVVPPRLPPRRARRRAAPRGPRRLGRLVGRRGLAKGRRGALSIRRDPRRAVGRRRRPDDGALRRGGRRRRGGRGVGREAEGKEKNQEETRPRRAAIAPGVGRGLPRVSRVGIRVLLPVRRRRDYRDARRARERVRGRRRDFIPTRAAHDVVGAPARGFDHHHRAPGLERLQRASFRMGRAGKVGRDGARGRERLGRRRGSRRLERRLRRLGRRGARSEEAVARRGAGADARSYII
mmetsp:Transcript_33512/g.103831  ORF Transcript_33512/g.103831 Transcript_33512/m.103831 type:complete len:311 (-) Transcript_33512:972-1904(-)